MWDKKGSRKALLQPQQIFKWFQQKGFSEEEKVALERMIRGKKCNSGWICGSHRHHRQRQRHHHHREFIGGIAEELSTEKWSLRERIFKENFWWEFRWEAFSEKVIRGGRTFDENADDPNADGRDPILDLGEKVIRGGEENLWGIASC